jgi:hypothetical protein
MALQTYLVRCQAGSDLDTIKRVVVHIRDLRGLILMTTSTGTIIAAFDDSLVERVSSHAAVILVGGVTLNPNGAAAAELHRIFAENLAQQVSQFVGAQA